MAKKLASVIVRTSRFLMCVSSCASTPSISCWLEPAQEPGRHGDGGVLRVAPGGERVRDVGVDDRDARHRQLGHRAEPLDRVVQLRRLVALDDLRAGGAQRELVGREVLEEREPDDDQEHRDEPDVQELEQDDGERDVEQPEQRGVKNIRSVSPRSRP